MTIYCKLHLFFHLKAAKVVIFFYIIFAFQQIYTSPLDNSIQYFDIHLFKKINFDWTNTVFDSVMPFIRESVVWTPLYLFLWVFMYMNFGKEGFYWFLGGILMVVIGNYISSDLIKPYFGRIRPCRESMLEPAANLLINRCPTSGSFTSSHAVNHFAMAFYIIFTLRFYVKWTYWFLLWAFLIGYAQVYVGVHYPLDIISGAMLGFLIAFIIAAIFNSKVHLKVKTK